MFKLKFIIIAIISVYSTLTNAQLLDSLSLDTLTPQTDLVEALKNPDSVIKLVLRRQHLKSFPIEIFKFKNLQYLDISKNNIKELPDSINMLSNLQYLKCSNTGLERISKDIGKLTHLYYLNVNQNELVLLPPQIGNLQNLQYLDMWSNNFDEYPETFGKLTNLRVIDLRNILISDEVQKHLELLMPKAKVYMSPSCKCKW